MSLFFNPLMLKGLTGVQETVISNWIGPAFIIAVAFFAIMFIKNRQFRELAAFIVIAAVVGLMIFFGPELFGKSGKLTTATDNVIKEVQMIKPFFPML